MTDVRQATNRLGWRLRAIIAAAGVSSLGDGAWAAAVPLSAAAITRDPMAVAVVSFAGLLPWLLVAPVAGALVDRWPHRPTLIAADLIRGSAVLLVMLGALSGHLNIAFLALGSFIVMSGAVFHGAATQSVVADLTDNSSELRNRANGLFSTAETSGASLIGPPAGSAMFTIARWLPFAADAVSFLVSAVLLTAVPRRPRSDNQGSGEAREGLRSSIRAGMSWLAHHRELRTLAALTGAANFTTNIVFALLVLFATAENGLAVRPSAYGFLVAALALGGVVGGPLAPILLRRLSFGAALLTAMSVRTLMWPILALTSSAIVAGAALAVAGLASSIVTVSVTSARQEHTPRKMLGRVVTTFRIVGNGTAPLGALAGGLAASLFGIRPTFWVAAAVMAVALIIGARAALRSAESGLDRKLS